MSRVRVNGRDLGNFSPTGRLIVYGQAGNDLIKVASAARLPAWLYGGDGNDVLISGAGDDVLLGGAGNDRMLSGRGRDLLIGGSGSDRLLGNAEADLLFPDTTAFDDDIAALDAILAEWTSSRSFAARVANLNGTGTGPRANGNFFLLKSGPNPIVLDDAAVDLVIGALES